jgi:hypothetical protein
VTTAAPLIQLPATLADTVAVMAQR